MLASFCKSCCCQRRHIYNTINVSCCAQFLVAHLNYLLWVDLGTSWTLLHKLHSLNGKWRYWGSDQWSNFTVTTHQSQGLALERNLQLWLQCQGPGRGRALGQATSTLSQGPPKSACTAGMLRTGHSHPSVWSFASRYRGMRVMDPEGKEISPKTRCFN